MCKIDDFLMFEILLELLACTCTQSFIILDAPSCRLCVCSSDNASTSYHSFGRFVRLFPCAILAFIIEYFLLCSLLRLQNRRIHKADKSGDFGKRRPFALKHIDSQPLDMRAVQILVRHKQYFAISQTVFYVIGSIFSPDFKPEDLLDFRNFVVFRDFFERFSARIHHFTLHRINANKVAVFATKTRYNTSLC